MAAPESPTIARQVLDEANVSLAVRETFLDLLKSFLTTDSPELDLGMADQFAVWGESLTHIVSHLFNRARVPSPKASAIDEEEDVPNEKSKGGSKLKEYQLTPDEFQLWQEIQKERSQSQIMDVSPMPSSEVFVVDTVLDE
jgi:hypothetical protein